MKYSFYKKIIDTTKRTYFLVKAEKNYSPLQNIDFTKKDVSVAQAIIDGVEASRNSTFAEAYSWANEDVSLKSMQHGVFLWDDMARRSNKNLPAKQDLMLTHDEFITFMTDFKNFIQSQTQ